MFYNVDLEIALYVILFYTLKFRTLNNIYLIDMLICILPLLVLKL